MDKVRTAVERSAELIYLNLSDVCQHFVSSNFGLSNVELENKKTKYKDCKVLVCEG